MIGEIIQLKPEDLSKCFSFWDFQDNTSKRTRITEELILGKRNMFVYTVKGSYIAGLSISSINLDLAYLSYLVVKEEYRDNGIGSKLIDYAVEYARNNGYKEICLQVESDNVRVINLYIKKGFGRGHIVDNGRTELYKCTGNLVNADGLNG